MKKQVKTPVYKAEGGFFHFKASVNGREHSFQAKPGEYLLDVLRGAGYRGTKKGCDTGDCGSCTVFVDGKAVLSCLLPAVKAAGASIVTIEGLGSPARPHPIQEAYVEAGAVQCGFCIPGMIIATKALLDKNPNPDEPEIRAALDGNLCRCTGYVKQVDAVKLAAARLKTGKK